MIQTLTIAGRPVSSLALGCMGMSWAYGAADEKEAVRTIHRAVDLGVTMFDTAEVYGPFKNETLVGMALKEIPSEKLVVASKCGFAIKGQNVVGVNGRPESIRLAAEGSLKRLGRSIDLYYLHRADPKVPIEDSVGELRRLKDEGKIGAIGLSEVSGELLRRAHKVAPIAALQSEYSIWARDVERSILATCEELGVRFVAYSPLGRGFLTGTISSVETLEKEDMRRRFPRFEAANLAANSAITSGLARLATAKGCTSAQLALAWVLTKPVVALFGTKKVAYLEENLGAASLSLTQDEKGQLDALGENVKGERYYPGAMKWIVS